MAPASPDDEPFLHTLYADRRAPEVAALGWGPAQAEAFIDMQFRAQQAGYSETFPEADHWIVTVDEAPVGRLLVDRQPDEHRVVDVVVMTSHRRRGIGTALMREVMVDAGGARLSVRLSAAAHDLRLVRWYERLGFAVIGPVGPNVAMEWSPSGPEGG